MCHPALPSHRWALFNSSMNAGRVSSETQFVDYGAYSSRLTLQSVANSEEGKSTYKHTLRHKVNTLALCKRNELSKVPHFDLDCHCFSGLPCCL